MCGDLYFPDDSDLNFIPNFELLKKVIFIFCVFFTNKNQLNRYICNLNNFQILMKVFCQHQPTLLESW